MRSLSFLIIFLGLLANAHAQNRVANGGFEEKNICVEYKVACAPEAWFRIPWAEVYGKSPENILSHSGKYFQTIAVENFPRTVSYRSFIYTKLLCPLIKDTAYIFSLWVHTFNNSFDHLDIWLPDIEPIRTKKKLSDITPDITFTLQHASTKLADGWFKVTYNYLANGSERYLMFGNFSKEPLLSAERTLKNGDVLYAFDDVVVQPVNRFAPCNEIEAARKQLYDMNYRHTGKISIDDIRLHPDLIAPQPLPADIQPKLNDTVIIETSLQPPTVVNDTLVLPDILFRFNSSAINPGFATLLDFAIKKIEKANYRLIEIAGHTDNVGNANYNQTLSLNRARSIRDYFVQKKMLPTDIIKIYGKGATQPIDDNTTAEGRMHNRRVEIILVK